MFGKLGKLARIAALVAALSSACKSRSDKFLDLVAKKDKAVAAQLLHNPQKEAQYDKVWKALEDIDYILWWKPGKRNVEALPVFSGGGFFYDLLRFFELNYTSTTLTKLVNDKVKPIRDAGLTETVEEQRNNLLNYCLGFDKYVADKIDKETSKYIAGIKKRQFEHREGDMEPKEAITYLQKLLQAAKKAGFTKITDAAQNALINIRGALAK